jgi:soluble lytic murein transglycosylase-like protein/TolA-binding protein
LIPRHLRTLVLLFGVLLAGCVAATEKDATPSPGEGSPEGGYTAGALTPVATPTISLTPPANSTPADPSTAHRLEAEGEVPQALEAYLTISASNASNRAEGVLGAARTLLQMERPAEARTVLEPFLATAAPAEAAPAHYLLARAYTALSMFNEALSEYDLYIQSGRPASPYAYLDKARILMDFGQPATAAVEAQKGLDSVPSGARRAFVLIAAQSYEKAGDFANATQWYQRLFDTSAGDQPLALSRIAAIKQAQGLDASADLARLMSGYPTSQLALDALNGYLSRGQSIDPYIRGLVFYRHNDYDKAEPAFLEKINSAPDDPGSAEAYYFEAAILESKGKFDDAQADYARVVALNPDSTVADDALWWRGRLLEDDGKLSDAQAVFARIVNDYPNSSWADDAAFRRGELSYHDGKYSEAASIWAQGLASATDPVERQRFAFWQGKALLKASNKTAGEPVLKDLASTGEDDYYGIRAVAELKGDHGQPKMDRDTSADLKPGFDWSAAEAWLKTKTGLTVTPAESQSWSSDARWSRARELWLVGRNEQAGVEAFDLIEAYAHDAIAMYTMARTLEGLGQFSLSARAGQRLLRVLNTNPNQGLPKALMSLSYPAPFAASIQKYAQAEKISPLLMLAFIRQESFFDPSALSGAPAYGLTQLLVSTARSVSAKIGAGDITAGQLFQADLNLRLGASYMAGLLKDFDSQIFVAFAGYNAGSNAARRWAKDAGDDADLFLETVEFSETRLYVEIVAENYAIYRYLYGGSPIPELPD